MAFQPINHIKAGDQIAAEWLNKMVDAINTIMAGGAGAGVRKLGVDKPLGITEVGKGHFFISTRGLTEIGLYKVVADWSDADVSDDGTKFYTCTDMILPDSPDGEIEEGGTDITVYDPAGRERTLAFGDLVYVVTNPGTGRYEALVGGVGTNMSSNCHTIAGFDFLNLPVVAPIEGDYVLGIADGCLHLFPVGDCQTS